MPSLLLLHSIGRPGQPKPLAALAFFELFRRLTVGSASSGLFNTTPTACGSCPSSTVFPTMLPNSGLWRRRSSASSAVHRSLVQSRLLLRQHGGGRESRGTSAAVGMVSAESHQLPSR